MSDNYPFRTFNELAKTIKDGCTRLPSDIDLVVGIPRSGMIPAYMIGMFMNKRVCSVNELLNGKIDDLVEGYRIPDECEKVVKKILVVDDSLNTGRAIRKVKERLSEISDNYTFVYVAIYTNNSNNDLVDYVFDYIPTPRLFQWNYLNLIWVNQACFDMDGVLCVDPHEADNDDGKNYEKFLVNAKPLFIPQFKINTIVTSRLEKYRNLTETWLKQNNVKYDRLIMLNLSNKEERLKYKAHAIFKAQVYRKLSDTSLFIESDPIQAEKIAVLSGKTVICSTTDQIFYGESIGDTKRIETKVVKNKEYPANCIKTKQISSGKSKVSVVIPVHNAEKYLQACLNSIRFQTFSDIEIIAVNDGSTDNSLAILQENSLLDERIVIINQECRYAGNARNTGMNVATGEYILFLDADDFFECSMIEKIYEKIKSTCSDICLFKCKTLDDVSGKINKRDLELKMEYVPDTEVFSSEDIPEFIFNFTTGAPWNKLFRTDFVRKNGLEFQGTHHYNDFYFSYSALSIAKRICYVNDELVTYRINNNNSLQSNMKHDPIEFSVATLGLKRFLVDRGIYQEFKKSYINRCLDTCIYVLFKQDNYQDFEYVYNKLKYELFEKMDITWDVSSSDIYKSENYILLVKILKYSPQEYLYAGRFERADQEENTKWKLRKLMRAIEDKNKYIEELKFDRRRLSAMVNDNESQMVYYEDIKYRYEETKKSFTYRLGMFITYIPRMIKRKFGENG